MKTLARLAGFIVVAQCWTAAPAVAQPILTYSEKPIGGGYVAVSFTAENNLDRAVYAGFNVDVIRLVFPVAPFVLSVPSGWQVISLGTTVEVFSAFPGGSPRGTDINIGDSLGGFSFLLGAPIGDIPFTYTFVNGAGTSLEEGSTSTLIDGSDITPPVITPHVTGNLGNSGWYVGPVTVNWDVSDPESGILSSLGCGEILLNADTPGATLVCSATNGSGVSTSARITVKIDQTQPVLIGSISFATLWPPNGKLVVDTISGTINDALSGVDPTSVSFNVIDEYGQMQPTGRIRLDNAGKFSVSVPLEASRHGSDLDGRTYQIVVAGSDQAGNRATQTIVVTVPHDQGR